MVYSFASFLCNDYNTVSQTVVHKPPVIHDSLTGGPQQSAGTFGRKSIAKIVSDTEQMKIPVHPYLCLLKLPLLVDLQQKVLVLSITSCPTITLKIL
jgi:hypothetical protein